MVIVMAKEKGTAEREKGMAERERVREKGNHQVMVLMMWKATLMGIRIRDLNYV